MESVAFVGNVQDIFRIKGRGVVIVYEQNATQVIRVNYRIRIDTDAGQSHHCDVLGIEHVKSAPNLTNPMALLVSMPAGVDLKTCRDARVYLLQTAP